MSAVDDDQLLQHLGVIHREDPRDVGAPVVADQDELLVFAGNLLDELPHVFDEVRHLVGLEPLRPRRQVVAAHIEADGQVIAAHFRHLVFPLVPERRVAVEEQHQRPCRCSRSAGERRSLQRSCLEIAGVSSARAEAITPIVMTPTSINRAIRMAFSPIHTSDPPTGTGSSDG